MTEDEIQVEVKEVAAPEEPISSVEPVPESAPDGDAKVDAPNEDTAETISAVDQEESASKQQSRDEVLTALKDWGLDEKIIGTFDKLSRKFNFPQFIDQAIGLFPEAKELFSQFNEIGEQDLEESDKKNKMGEAASKKIDQLTTKTGVPLAEEQRKVADLAMKILVIGSVAFAGWFGKGWKDSDLRRLIDAVVKGADYNSAGAMSKNYKEAGDENQISADKFFKKLAENPKDNLDKIRGIKSNLSTELNWKDGEKILQNDDGKKDNEVLRDYFLAMSAFMHKSTAENLLWEKASALLVKEIFEENNVIDPEVLKELHEMNQDTTMSVANNRFIAR